MDNHNMPADRTPDADPVADDATRADMAARADEAVNASSVYNPATFDAPDLPDAADDLAGREKTEVEKTDDRPALSGIAPGYDQSVEYDADDADDEVDLSDMPRLRSFQHELPSARFTMVARGVEVIRELPDSLFKSGGAASLKNADMSDDDFDMSKLDVVSDLAKVLPLIESYVIDMSSDRDQMTEWLKTRGDVASLMGAFNLAQAHVKN